MDANEREFQRAIFAFIRALKKSSGKNRTECPLVILARLYSEQTCGAKDSSLLQAASCILSFSCV